MIQATNASENQLNSVQSIVEKHWDYSTNAQYYQYRPNYAPKAIDALLAYVGYTGNQNEFFKVADIGAGTGNLSLLLSACGLKVFAVEPNDAMRTIGLERSLKQLAQLNHQGVKSIEWSKATGIETLLPSNGFDWVTFGSSFNVIDREQGLKETSRILKPRGYFSCMWNHRDLNDPIQNQAEAIILKHVPGYTRGVRREDQRVFLEKSPTFQQNFQDISYLEVDFNFEQSCNNYLMAWQSVKNSFWDLTTPEGQSLFNTIQEDMRENLPEKFSIRYTTRVWTAQKK
ncbi:MAG: methyltransferase domain-containing protein [Cyanobacteria bacterium]|nr:methyltransferase domain-containing protein [Cyanobacteriota bacterium]